MDWIRRNWPDLLIGIALLLVIAGIIATLLSGGTILPFANNQNPQTPTAITDTETPTTTTTDIVTDTTNGVANTANAATQALENTANQVGNTVTNAANNTVDAVTDGANAVAEGAENIIAPVIPDSTTSDTTTTTDTATTTSATSVDASNTDSTSTTASTGTDTTTSSATTTADPVNVSASSSSAAPYRVSVGAFGSVENAERQAETFRDAGYPVFLGSQGSLSLVLVGPYDSADEAEAVQTQIRSSGLEPGATIYQLDSNEDTSPTEAATTSTQTTPTPEAATNTTSTPVASSSVPVTATSGRYLQVGAYNSVESSLPQRQILEGFGFTVVHIEESNFIKLLVGPYDSTNLGLAQSQLNAQGIESFVR